MNWEPPKFYLALLQKAFEAGYQPSEIQKDWLAKAQQSGEKNYDLPEKVGVNSTSLSQ